MAEEAAVPPTREELLVAALGYAAQGIPVFPVGAGEKKPATTHGFKDATTDPDQIRSWWREQPYNVGIPTGSASGIDVLDIDLKTEMEHGYEAVRRLREQEIMPPAFRYVTTPRGGMHLYFRASGNGCSVDGTAHIDIRGDGGYVVAPPSWSAMSRQRYTVAADAPDEQDRSPALRSRKR